MPDEVLYPFELKPNQRPAISANPFNFDGYLQAQGRNVMEALQKAQSEHPAVQAGNGKPVLKAMRNRATGKITEINAPYRVTVDGKESWAGVDDVRKLERDGFEQVEFVDYSIDPKDSKIRELTEQVRSSAKLEQEVAELREMVAALKKRKE